MNKYISALCALVIGTLLLTSCLGTSDDSDIVYYNDTAITSFTLTSVTRIIHTTSKSGKDSVYRRALSNPVTFSIDQNRRKVYNLDSLFADCDLSHVLVSIGTKNNGYVDHDATAAGAVSRMIMLPNGRYYADKAGLQQYLINRAEALYVIRDITMKKT